MVSGSRENSQMRTVDDRREQEQQGTGEAGDGVGEQVKERRDAKAGQSIPDQTLQI